MKFPTLLACCLATAYAMQLAHATPLDDKIAAFQEAVKTEARLRPQSVPVPVAIDQLLKRTDEIDEGMLTQLLAVYTSDAVQKTGGELLAEIRKERKEKADATTAALKALVARVHDGINAAKQPEDLDDLLVDLQKNQQNGYGGPGFNPEDQPLIQQISSALQFTKIWQDYLAHLKSGQQQEAMNDLRELSQNNMAIGIMPRSKILALMAGKSAADTSTPSVVPVSTPYLEVNRVVDGIKTLDDFEPAMERLYSMANSGNNVARPSADGLRPMVEAYNDIRQGLPTSVNITFMGGMEGGGISGPANLMMLDFILQHYFDTYPGAAPAAGEFPTAYVNRVKLDALARQDWALLKKALTAHAFLTRNVASGGGISQPDDETAGLDSLITALNQETAQQYALAVASYQAALKAPNVNIPAKFIGEKLEALRKNHPDEYAQGMNPAPSVAMPGNVPPGMNPLLYQQQMMMRMRAMQGYPGMQGNTFSGMTGTAQKPNPVLAIPGAATGAVTNAAPVEPPTPATNAAPAPSQVFKTEPDKIFKP